MLPILNLNKHPKDCKNLSLINAENVRLSNDGSCLQSENSIINNNIITDFITQHYNARYQIIKLIPCNTELIIITASYQDIYESKPCNADIFRYDERTNSIKLVYEDYLYYGGTLNGTFTYNVNNELIVAIAESDGEEDVPLKTINFGKFEEDIEQLPNELLSINPELYIPTLIDYNYLPGNLPKGWYYIFIRYKIDNNDYTKWFDIGGPILVNNIEKQSIFKFYGYQKQDNDYQPFSTGILDHFSSIEDYSNETLSLNIKYLDNRYKKYQIAFICVNKLNVISYKSFDINIDVDNYIINIDSMESYDYNEMISNNLNFYNVKNLINYENRLYISNYKEKNLLNYDTSNIKINLFTKIKEYNDLKNIQYENSDNNTETYLTIDNESDYFANNFNNDSAENIIYPNLNINGNIYNTLLIPYNEYIVLTGGYSGIGRFYIRLRDENWNLKSQVTTQIKDGVTNYIIKDILKIITENNNIINIEFYADIKEYSIDGDCYFKYTFNNNVYLSKCKIASFDYVNQILECYIIDNLAEITSEILIQNNIESDVGNKSIYINTKNSFNERKKESTLIPGEIYNFYIHFVDKYGFSTNGFKLEPKSILPYTPILINYDDGNYKFKYITIKNNTNVFNNLGEINFVVTDDIGFGDKFIYKNYGDNPSIQLFGASAGEELLNNIIIKLTELYGNLSNNLNLKWEDLAIGNIPAYILNNEDEYNTFIEENALNNISSFKIININNYSIYYNKNNEKLFKIPYNNINVIPINNTYNYQYNTIELNVENITLPEGYVGYYLSYEKFEETNNCTGLLTKYDFNSDIHLNNNTLNNHNNDSGTKMYFYSSDFDTLDDVNFKYNILRIEKKNNLKSSLNGDIIVNSVIQNINNLNLPELTSDENFDILYYNISNYNIQIANDPKKNRFGLGTCLEIPIIDSLFPDNEINLYTASLLYIDNNNYTNEDKKLIKCTNTIYPEKYEESLPIQYLNGRHTYNNFLIYDNNRFIYNTSDNKVYAEKNKEYIDYGNENENSNGNISKFLAYIQIPVYKNFFYETKSFKNSPKQITFKLNEDNKNIDIQLGTIIEPSNSLDLFENKYTDIDNLNPKIYLNNRTDIKYISQFDKFIRRSNVIQDESLNNSWRKFELENYKIISENKGKITNLIGIGTYLIAHTEHSIFVFNNDNVLKTQDRDVQLEMPDIFTMDYKELVTSELGYCGLQDSDAYLLGEFGYIFYDNDSYRIYKFDNGQIDTIDNDIVQFLKKYKPYRIRFAHDQYSTRILLNIEFYIGDNLQIKTLSYNYKYNNFISFHDYIFYEAVNTKNNLYLLRKSYPNVYNINYNEEVDNYVYNQFANGNDEIRPSKLDIIINDQYNLIKYLECIIYKLYRIRSFSDNIYESSPVEKIRKPYSGEQIRIYNDEVDTGWLDIKIDVEDSKNVFNNFDKPHWDLGNWNFNYFRNKLSNSSTLDFVSRLYGNYFIISIIFGDSNERVEFESLGYNITKDKRI